MSGARPHTVYYRRSRFTTHLPVDRRYSPAHYWLLEESPGIWRVGLTRFATRMLGDIVEFAFTATPAEAIATGDEIGSIEGLKAVTSVFSAGNGRFLGEGDELRQDVTLADSDPYGKGWLYRLQGTPAADAVDVHGYIAVLDATIDKMLASRHADDGEDDDVEQGAQ
jgi:glycine cleavage system H protein